MRHENAALLALRAALVLIGVRRPYTRLTEVHACFQSAWSDPRFIGTSCYGNRAGGFAEYDLLLYFWDHRLQLVDTTPDYSVPVFLFEFSDDLPRGLPLGIASSDFRDGSQAYVAVWSSPASLARGVGSSAALVHEVGHHLGLSHPHDGTDYDPVTGILLDFGTGYFWFAWTGDEVASVMHYAKLAHGFSQFDLDSMARWMTIGYLNQANQVLASIVGSPHHRDEAAAVLSADQAAYEALVAYFFYRDYQAAASLAKEAYETLLAAAARLHIPIEPQATQADAKATSTGRFFVDPIDPYSAPRLPGAPPMSFHVDSRLAEQPDGWFYPPN